MTWCAAEFGDGHGAGQQRRRERQLRLDRDDVRPVGPFFAVDLKAAWVTAKHVVPACRPREGGDRQRRVDPRVRPAARVLPVRRSQVGPHRADPEHGARLRRRRDPGQRGLPRLHPHAARAGLDRPASRRAAAEAAMIAAWPSDGSPNRRGRLGDRLPRLGRRQLHHRCVAARRRRADGPSGRVSEAGHHDDDRSQGADAVLDRLLTDGYVVVEHVLDRDTTDDLRSGSNVCSTRRRANPFDAGPDAPEPDESDSRVRRDLGPRRRRAGAASRSASCFSSAASSTPRGRYRTRTSASASSTSRLNSTAADHSGSSTSSTRISPSLPCWNIHS